MAANPNIKLDFVNKQPGYFYKFLLITFGWGIPSNIKFFDEDFYDSINSDFDTPGNQKIVTTMIL